MPHKTTVKTNGQILTVNASVSHWTTEALALTASGTNDVESTTTTVISSDYDLWFANTATTATITVKQRDGSTLATYSNLQVNPGVGTRILDPLPDRYQVAADVGGNRQIALMPTGAVAETYPRMNGTTTNIASTLTSGRMHCYAVHLPKDTVCTNITFVSGTTAANTPTAQWFALYDSSRVLLRQTANDGSTAWADFVAKTLALSSSFTTTYSGLHYLGIMVAAATPPTLLGYVATSTVLGIAPIVSGYDNTNTGLTTTAPATAAALTTGGSVAYAYVT